MKPIYSLNKSTSYMQLKLTLHLINAIILAASQFMKLPVCNTLKYKVENTLYDIINLLGHEKPLYELVFSIVDTHLSPDYKDLKKNESLFEVFSEKYPNLYSITTELVDEIADADCVRINTYLYKNPELLVIILQNIRNSIKLDIARSLDTESNLIESETTYFRRL